MIGYRNRNRRLRFITAAVFILVAILPAAYAAGPNWSDWERANSVAKEGNWLVIRQPDEGFCYIEQGYEGSRDKMNLSMKKDRIPYLTTPFRGIEGEVSYRVDDKSLRLVPEKDASAFGIKFSADVVAEMRQGTTLSVRVKPKGQSTLEQQFQLRGFGAAERWLDREDCRKKVPDRHKE